MFFIKILIISSVVFVYAENDKTFDLKIGFDLTNGENGMPALRIREFEGSSKPANEIDTKVNTEIEHGNIRMKINKPSRRRKSKILRTEDSESKSKSNTSESKSGSKSEEKEEKKPKVRQNKNTKEKTKDKKSAEKKHKKSQSESNESNSKDSDDGHNNDSNHKKNPERYTRGMDHASDYEPEEKTKPKAGDSDDDTRKKRYKRQAIVGRRRQGNILGSYRWNKI